MDTRGIRRSCPSCGTVNRLVYGALHQTSRCGSCGTTLAPPDGPVETPSPEVFEAARAASSLPILVDFWAPWCGPCRAVAPELDKVAARHAGEWLVVKVNTEAHGEIGQQFRIQSIPTMAVFSAGHEVARSSGARPAEAIETFAHSALTGTN